MITKAPEEKEEKEKTDVQEVQGNKDLVTVMRRVLLQRRDSGWQDSSMDEQEQGNCNSPWSGDDAS